MQSVDSHRERTLSGILVRAAAQFPAVVLTGPRQSGKTTLVRHHFGSTHNYCSLDDPASRELAISDPQLLLRRFPPPTILDEIQYAPDLLHYVKADIDAHRQEKGRYIITGSQAFPMMKGVTESLAGRTAILSLLSFSLREFAEKADSNLSSAERLQPSAGVFPLGGSEGLDQLADAILRGGFPEPALATNAAPELWHSSYLQTYLERDVRSLRAVGDLNDFQSLVLALAARSGNLINYSDLARDLGITSKTAKAWISVLEASGQVVTVRPYHSSLGKRLVKRPKVYFLDTGMLSYLLALRDTSQVFQGISAGALFETAVFGQLHRLFAHRGELPRIYFWRTASGHEVDFIVETGAGLVPIEAKLTSTPSPRHAKSITRLRKDLGPKAAPGLLVCLTPEPQALAEHVTAIPLGCF